MSISAVQYRILAFLPWSVLAQGLRMVTYSGRSITSTPLIRFSASFETAQPVDGLLLLLLRNVVYLFSRFNVPSAVTDLLR
jgi:hypothetical protein